MLQFLTGNQFSERPPPTNHRPVFLFPSAVPESNQRTHACPPANPGRNTLPSPAGPHHPQILIQGSETKQKMSPTPTPTLTSSIIVPEPGCDFTSVVCRFFFALASESSG